MKIKVKKSKVKIKKVQVTKKQLDKIVEKQDREIYLSNRNNMLEDFHNSLEEVQKDKPSVGGEICGKNFQQFAASSVFYAIKEQEEYIAYTEKYKPAYVILKEEKKILKDMIAAAKKVFGEKYDEMHIK
jgi:hypothetical protein